MSREHRLKDQLVKASEHLYYEYMMFMNLANALSTGVFGESVIKNAVLESFTVHTRNLLDFLYAEKPRNDDIIAIDFFEKPEAWSSNLPDKSPLLASTNQRVAKEIAHLTYNRVGVTPDEKPWKFLQIANEINSLFQRFRNLVPNELLDERWNDPAQPKEEY